MDVAKIVLKKGREKAVRQGHPWLFSGAVANEEGPTEAGLAEVSSADGTVLGIGFYSPRSQIRVRFLGGPGTVVDRAFFAERLAEAATLRSRLLGEDTTGYRMLNAEGDGVPGWTLDRYGDVVVSQVTSAGLERLRHEAYAALAEHLDEEQACIVQANDHRGRRQEGLGQEDEAIGGTTAGDVPGDVRFRESGLTFTAELGGGQKTGFYCDQRPNRRLAGRLAVGRDVLDLFAHTGAFSVYARRGDARGGDARGGGARRVVAVESAGRLIERGREHLRLNGMGSEDVEWVQANVFEYLRQEHSRQPEEGFGVVVCDPPPLVTRRGQLDRGARAYKDLNRLALQRVKPGGFLLTFSCSAAVNGKLFRQILFAAAEEAGVRLALLRPLAAGEDHPVSVYHPQGEYLKGWLATVAGPRL